MPTYIRPARVIVDTGSSALGALATTGGAGVVVAGIAVTAVFTEWWPLLLGVGLTTAVVTALTVRLLHRRTVLVAPNRLAASQRAARSLSEPPRVANRVRAHAARELPPVARAIGAPVIVVRPDMVFRPAGGEIVER